jgi:hypothetical protein
MVADRFATERTLDGTDSEIPVGVDATLQRHRRHL